MDFNKQQLQAINFHQGNLQLIASAGSGKSTVLVNRINTLVNKYNENQEDILAISFTRNAANDLKRKLNDMGLFNVNTGTFHSVCKQILFENGIDVSNQLRDWQIKNCFQKINQKADMDDILSFIGYQKNYGLTYKDRFIYKDSKYDDVELEKFFKAYEDLKKQHKAYDFEDWLILAIKTLKKNPKTWKYVLVDESQDNNTLNEQLIKLISKNNNLCYVGDYKQNIYSFRGTNPKYFMNFDKNWDKTTVINMDINYRSTKNVVENSNHFIKQYYGDYEHYSDAVADNKNNGEIKLFSNQDKKQEAINIVNSIQEKIDNGEDLNSIAILYRLNTDSECIECELKKRNIKYYIANDSSFFKKNEIKLIMGYLRLINNPADDGAFEDVYNSRNQPLTYFNKDIFNTIKENAGLNNKSFYETFISTRFIKSWQNKCAMTLYNDLNKLSMQEKTGISIERLIDNIVNVFKVKDYIKGKYTDNQEEVSNRLNSMEILKSFIRGDNLAKFIEFTESSNINQKDKDGVQLMTIHKSKGLEWDNVYIVGIQDNKFPHEKSKLEDEARLFYVGITRPRKNLYLSQIGKDNLFVNQYFN